MGNRNKMSLKGNVFKVAGAKSLKKTKAKMVNLGLKNIKQKVKEMDKEFVELNNKPKTTSPAPAKVIPPKKKVDNSVTKEEVAETADAVVKMDL